MKSHYNLDRQSMVCLGPGPLLSKEFLRQFSAEPDSEFVHEELTLPAYAEIFGIHIKNTGMHPGFFAYKDDDKYFSCVENAMVSWKTIQECLRSDNSRRSFHPVKYILTKDSVEKLGV